MIKFQRYPGIILILFTVVFFVSCRNKKNKTSDSYDKGNYFSIYQYALDSWNNFKGMPFPILKIVRVNEGKIDSSYTNSDTISWAPIFTTFFATDISAKKYLDQYNVSSFRDPQDGSINLFYKAKDPDFYTQKLLLTFDQDTRNVRGIYVETFEKTALKETVKRLYYSPYKTIQIQTDEKPVLGSRKHTVEQWDFILQG